MKNPSIKNLIKHNENIIEKTRIEPSCKCLPCDIHYRAVGWTQALNYITNNYNLEEK